MRKIVSCVISTILIACIVRACSDNLDIKRSYEFQVTHLPVLKRLEVGETAEIRCQQIRAEYEKTKYDFQPDGKGELKLNDGTIFLPQ